jgi:ABC-type nitrate/sulfonate/bicarbonate transport system substrate-binding protein
MILRWINWKRSLVVLISFAALSCDPAWCLEKVRLGVSTRNVVLMPFYYAKDKKLFEKQGLDVEIIQIRSNLQLVGLVSGELDLITGIGTAIEGIGKGIPVKAVGVLYRAPLFSLLSQLPNPKALEGKKVSVSRIGSESHFNGVLMFEKSGADPKKVTWIQTGNTALNMVSLEQGLVDGAVLSPPFTGMMARKGFKILKRSGDVIDASPFNGLVTTRDKIQSHPERIKNALKAVLASVKLIRQDRKPVIAYIVENFNVNQGVAEEAYDDIAGVMLDDLMMAESGMKKYLEIIHSRGETGRLLAPNEVVDYSFLKSVK